MAKRSSKNKKVVAILILIALVAIGGALYIKASQPKSATATYNPDAKTKYPGSANQSGGVVDNNQKATATPATTTPATTPAASSASSTSGIITLNSPLANAKIGNGTTVSGTASGLSQIQYRIEGTNNGQLAAGPLNVVNGQFSGTLEGLNTNGATTGTFEVFDFKNGNGPEENSVTINVSF
ncbi:MAG TPA: hypothetical protein VMR75_01760 [Candidatus Saccharimonadales bacterium]|nr:hypothetical protein [Candidatus Saccharimonadales bacterium]